jgi:catechol 2,3-dioxygenase-like lactoylglutathione lyase family enzyme
MIKVRSLKYVIYGVSDVEKTKAYMVDFGLTHVPWPNDPNRAYMRGALGSPYIYIAEESKNPSMRVIGIELFDAQDLLLASRIDGASPIRDLDRPGGGKCVEIVIPGGTKLELVHGIQETSEHEIRRPLLINEGLKKSRLNTPQRPERIPAQVLRLGHVAFCISDPVETRQWLERHLGMVLSDAMLVPGSKDEYIGFFMRWNHGAAPTDHHTFLLAKAKTAHVHHCSFELQDIDAVYMGHEWMKFKEHRHHWGVGRHVLGSQVFDYWWDPDGFRVERYADGDLFDNTVRATTVQGTNEQLWTWGPSVPESFFQEARYI